MKTVINCKYFSGAMMKYFVMLWGLIFYSSIASAGVESEKLTIKTLATGWQGVDLYVWVNQDVLIGGCANKVFRMSSDHPSRSEISAMLLSAFHSDTKVRIFVDGCYEGSMRIQAVKLDK